MNKFEFYKDNSSRVCRILSNMLKIQADRPVRKLVRNCYGLNHGSADRGN